MSRGRDERASSPSPGEKSSVANDVCARVSDPKRYVLVVRTAVIADDRADADGRGDGRTTSDWFDVFPVRTPPISLNPYRFLPNA